MLQQQLFNNAHGLTGKCGVYFHVINKQLVYIQEDEDIRFCDW